MTSQLRRLVGVACALLLVLLWASTSGSTRVWRSSLDTDPSTVNIPNEFEPATTDTVAPPPTPGSGPGNADSGATAWAIMQTLLLGVLLISIVWAALALRVLLRRGEGRKADKEKTFAVLPDVRSAITDDASAQMDALASGTPRNAIVACWVRLEDAVASIGLERHPAETASELTSRVLSRYAASPDAIDQLARLYREARFSTHELGEVERTRAIDALQRLHTDLGLVPAGTASGPEASS